MVLPKQELTVGELVPVEVKAYFRAGVSASLNGLPVLSSDAFTLNKLGDQPEQTRESIDGVPYTVVTWTSALSAVKAGDYPLNLDLPVMVRVKERGQRRGGGRNPFQDLFGDDSPFGDSFFDDFFGGVTEKPLTLHTDGAVVKIKALPAQGRPADFSGAVGKFDVTSEASATTGATGDPLTLKIEHHRRRQLRPRDDERPARERRLEELQTERALRACRSQQHLRHENLRAIDRSRRRPARRRFRRCASATSIRRLELM